MADLSHFLPRTQTALDQARQTQLANLSNNKSSNDAAIEAKAKEFESIFLAQMLKPMFDSLNTEEPFGGGFAEETFRSLLVDEYTETMVNAGGMGIADHVKRELLTLQEIQ